MHAARRRWARTGAWPPTRTPTPANCRPRARSASRPTPRRGSGQRSRINRPIVGTRRENGAKTSEPTARTRVNRPATWAPRPATAACRRTRSRRWSPGARGRRSARPACRPPDVLAPAAGAALPIDAVNSVRGQELQSTSFCRRHMNPSQLRIVSPAGSMPKSPSVAREGSAVNALQSPAAGPSPEGHAGLTRSSPADRSMKPGSQSAAAQQAFSARL